MRNTPGGFLRFLAALSLAMLPFERAAAVELPANIVIILADDLGYGDLGVYGHPTIRTPRLDRMAAEGVRLTEFYTPAPLCSPARAALLTGRYPRRSGMTRVIVPKEKWGLPASEITLADELKRLGYATACIGKWHLGGRRPYRPGKHGFDYFFGVLYSNDMSVVPLLKWPRLELWRNDEVVESPAKIQNLTRRYTEQAVSFIEQNRERPFFLYLPHTMPHTPVAPSDEFRGKSKHGPYGDVVEEIDWSTGEILDAISRNGLDSRTLVFFTSDNGPWVAGSNRKQIRGGSAGLLRGAKNTTWEAGMRVPLIARWPGHLPAGAVRAGITTLMDLFTTTLDAAGGKIPTDRVIDGEDIMPFLEGRQESPHDRLFYYFHRRLCAVRLGDWKLHLYKRELKLHGQPGPQVRCEPAELYNLATDAGEQHDVAKQHGDIVERLTKTAQEFDAAIEPVMKLPSTSRSVFSGLATQAPKDPKKVPK